jgi:lipopolysaccharide transport protein LptA
VIVLVAAAVGALSAAAVSPKTQDGSSIGVVRFESVAPAGIELPDVGTMLAERLGERGVPRVIAPAELGVGPIAEPSAEDVRAWAERTGVETLLTGRATRFGRRTSLDVRVRSAQTGAPIAVYVEEAATPEAISDAVDRLAERIASAGLVPAVGTEPSAPRTAGAPPDAPSSPDRAEEGPAGERNRGLPLRSDAPLSIRSDELEAVDEGGRRRLLFRNNVHVAQEDVTLTADRLEAFYPEGASQPEQLVATGRVRVAQQDRSMRCEEATYYRSEQRVLCRGSAELQQRNDRVRGQQIEIFLDSGRVRVSGGAVVNVRGDASDAPQGTSP